MTRRLALVARAAQSAYWAYAAVVDDRRRPGLSSGRPGVITDQTKTGRKSAVRKPEKRLLEFLRVVSGVFSPIPVVRISLLKPRTPIQREFSASSPNAKTSKTATGDRLGVHQYTVLFVVLGSRPGIQARRAHPAEGSFRDVTGSSGGSARSPEEPQGP